MRPYRDLPALGRVAIQRLARLRAEGEDATRPTSALSARDRNVLIAHSTVELWAAWHAFSRSLYLASAFRAREAGGNRISLGVPAPTSEQDAIGLAVRVLRPRKYFAKNGVGPWDYADEPNWKNPRQLLDALAVLQSSNQAKIQAALSTGTRTLSDLPEFRNFFAHRDAETLKKAQSRFVHYGHLPTERPGRVLSVPSLTAQGTGWQPLLLDWFDDLIDDIVVMAL